MGLVSGSVRVGQTLTLTRTRTRTLTLTGAEHEKVGHAEALERLAIGRHLVRVKVRVRVLG